jgi:peptidoglycan/LPS O-acetylase OafA/YrhL
MQLPQPYAPIHSDSERIPGLDLVRATAISLVLLSHMALFTARVWAPTSLLSVCGLPGVEIFFALSGYLIGGILYRSHVAGALSPPKFWRRRWLRTFPAYLVFFSINRYFWIRLAGPTALDWRYLVYLQNFNWPHPPFFQEAWSLAMEEWFYLLAPLLLVGLTLLLPRKRAFLGMASLLIGLPLIYRLLLVAYTDPSWDEGVRKIVLLRFDAIGLGVLMAYLHHEGYFAKRSVRRWLGLAGALLLSVSMAVSFAAIFTGQVDTSYFTRTWLLFICPLGAALTLPFFARITHLPGQLFSGAVRHLALISYSAYLCNGLIYLLITNMLRHLPAAWQAVLFLGGTLLVATISYWVVERPFIRWYRRLDMRRYPGAESSSVPSLITVTKKDLGNP